jgi:6-phosphogluconate dehydrogenase
MAHTRELNLIYEREDLRNAIDGVLKDYDSVLVEHQRNAKVSFLERINSTLYFRSHVSGHGDGVFTKSYATYSYHFKVCGADVSEVDGFIDAIEKAVKDQKKGCIINSSFLNPRNPHYTNNNL